MADAKTKPGVEVVATGRGEYPKNRMRERGERFTFYGPKLGKWMAPVEEAATALKSPPPMAGDTKPVEAQRAVRRKMAEASGDQLA